MIIPYRKIPKLVFYTFESNNLTNEVKNIIEHNKKISSNYKFNFYEKKDRELFILNNFDLETYNAYKCINPNLGVCQADFWRHCVLYVFGGVYLDIKTKMLLNLDNIIQRKDQFILDFPKDIYEKPSYDQGVLMCVPKHPYNYFMIKRMVEEIKLRRFPKISNKSMATPIKQIILRFSGPIKLGEIISEFCQRNKPIHRCINIKSFFYYDYNAIMNLYLHNKMLHYSSEEQSLYNDKPLDIIYF